MKLIKRVLVFAMFSFSLAFLSIGYAQLTNNLSVTGIATASQYLGVYISDVKVSSTSNVNANLTEINLFTETIVDSKIELGNNKNSKVTLETQFNDIWINVILLVTMAVISLTVAVVSYIIGVVAKELLGIDAL